MDSGLTLMEELMLVGLDDERGWQVDSTALPYALAGAVLLELVLRGKTRLNGDFVEIADRTPAGDEVLDQALALIVAAEKRKRVRGWVQVLPGKLKPLARRVAERLVDRGVLRVEEAKVLWIFPVTRYPQRDASPEREIRRRVREAVSRSRTLDERTACLVGLIGSANLVGQVFEKDRRSEARKRIKEIAKGNAFAGAVDRVVAETQAAVTAAVAVAVVAATSSSH